MKRPAANTIYRKIEVRTWTDEKFRGLSLHGKLLWLYLLTGPHTGIIPGLFSAGRAGLAEQLGWEPKVFNKAFDEIERIGMVSADFGAMLVWIPKAVIYNPPPNPNVAKAWGKAFTMLPECLLRDSAQSFVEGFLKGFGEGFLKGFAEGFGGTFANGRGNQEQEQEQDISKSPFRGEVLSGKDSVGVSNGCIPGDEYPFVSGGAQ